MSAISGASSPITPATTVSTPTGSTVLPAASGADFAQSPTPLDEKDTTYKTMIASHVAVLRAIGTPEMVIGQIAQTAPAARDFDAYIQNQIFVNPEGWDDAVGNQRGTARAGLEQLIPGFSQAYGQGPALPQVQLPAATITSTPGIEAQGGSGVGGVVAGVVLGGAAVGTGLLVSRFVKNRGAAKEGVEAGVEALKHAPVVDSSAGGDIAARVQDPTSRVGDEVLRTSKATNDPKAYRTGATLSVVGGARDLDEGTRAGAVVHSTLSGLGPADGELTSLNLAAINANRSIEEMVDFKVALYRARAEHALAQAGSNGATAAEQPQEQGARTLRYHTRRL